MLKRIISIIGAAGLLLVAPTGSFAQAGPGEEPKPGSGYAPVNGLEMYYEIHGTGEPLVVLHGAYMTIETMGEIIPRLAETRRVVAVELQGHGHTADVDRPLTYEQMADDVVAFMRYMGIEEADVFGYSMGGGVALQMAIRHPERLRKLVVASAAYQNAGIYPDILAMFETITPEMFAGTPFEKVYLEVAPNPEDFDELVYKLKRLDTEFEDWPAEDIRSIEAPALLIVGDSDVIRPEHAVEMFRLLGGGVPGFKGLTDARLAVLPATTHIGLINRVDLLVPMITEFLEKSITDAQAGT